MSESKYCFYCWIVNSIEKDRKKLEQEQKNHRENQKYSGYENSEEGKEREEKIIRNEGWISSHETQLSELTCLKNSTCGNNGEGTTINCCRNCGKYLSLSIDYRQDGHLKHDYYKSPDFYTHEKDCQAKS